MCRKLLIAIGVFLSTLGCQQESFPPCHEVLSSLDLIETSPAGANRTALIADLLEAMQDPRSRIDGRLVRVVLEDLRDLYVRERDDSVLQVTDSLRIDGGFANSVCSFYRELLERNLLPIRYAADPASADALRRCVGISVSREELEMILNRVE